MLKILFFSVFLPNLSFAGTTVFFSPKGGCEEQASQIVTSSKTDLEIAVYSLNSPTVVAAIKGAIERGVHVRILTDRTQAFGKGNLEATKTLASLTPDFRVHSKNRIMHNKYAIADSKKLMLGSFNWTRSAENSNDENCLITDDAKVVQAYENRFNEHLWIANTAEKSNAILSLKGIKIFRRSLASEKDILLARPKKGNGSILDSAKEQTFSTGH